MYTERSSGNRFACDASVAVVGCGHWGKNLVRNFHQLGALMLVCDDSPQGLASAERLVPDVDRVIDYDAVLASPVSGVVIAAPAEAHYALARRALEADKHVFVEKPLALTSGEGRDLVGMAQARRKTLMVGHVLEYHPAIRRLRQLVSEGALGKIQYISSNRLSLGKIRREENILWSFAPHDIAVILRLIGTMPLQVAACGGSYVQPNIADVTVTQLLFDGGVRAHVFVSWLYPFKEQRLVVVGSQRMATFDDVNKELLLYDQRVEFQGAVPTPVSNQGEKVDFSQEEPLKLECEAFLEAIATGAPPLADGHSGVRTLRVLEMAQRSLGMSGAPINLPLELLSGESPSGLSEVSV